MAFLQQRDGIHLELERLGFGNGGSLDVEVELVQFQRVHHFAVGGCQGLAAQTPLRVRLRQAQPCGTAQRYHHIATGRPQRIDFGADGQSLFVHAVQRQDVVTGPGQFSAGAGLHKAQGEEPHPILLRQTVEIGYGILPHVHVGSEELFLPQIAVGGCDGRRCRRRSGSRSGGRRWSGSRRGRHAADKREVTEHCRTAAWGGGEAEGRRTPGRDRSIPASVADGVVVARVAGDRAIPERRDLSVEVEIDRPVGIRGAGRVANRHVAVEATPPIARD